MFVLDEINEAYAMVKSGADFPGYIQALLKLGVRKYESFVTNRHTIFYGDDGYNILAAPKHAKLNVANISDKERFKHHLRNHQRGRTDYAAFCKYSAETGVEKWTVDINEMTCTYYDKSNAIMWKEQIPTAL